jgi:hypothetical protein
MIALTISASKDEDKNHESDRTDADANLNKDPDVIESTSKTEMEDILDVCDVDSNIDHGSLTESLSEHEGNHRPPDFDKDPNDCRVSTSIAEGECHIRDVGDVACTGLNRDPNTLESARDAPESNRQQEANARNWDIFSDNGKIHHDCAELLENPMMLVANEWVFLESNEKDKQNPLIQAASLLSEGNEDDAVVMHDDMPLCAFVSSRSKRKAKNLVFKEAESKKKSKQDDDEGVTSKAVMQGLDLPRKDFGGEDQHIDGHCKLDSGSNEQSEVSLEAVQNKALKTRVTQRSNPKLLHLQESDDKKMSKTGGLKQVRGRKKALTGSMHGNLETGALSSQVRDSLQEIETDDTRKIYAGNSFGKDGDGKVDLVDAPNVVGIHTEDQLKKIDSQKHMEPVEPLGGRKRKRKAKPSIVEEADGEKAEVRGSLEHVDNVHEKQFNDHQSVAMSGKEDDNTKTGSGTEGEDDERDAEIKLYSGVLQVDGLKVKPKACQRDEEKKLRTFEQKRLNAGVQQESNEKRMADTDEVKDEISENAELVVCEMNVDTHQLDAETLDPNVKVIQKPRTMRNNICTKKSTWGTIDVLPKVSEDLEMEIEKESSESKQGRKSESERAFRLPRKKKQREVTSEGDMEWEAVMGESDTTIAKSRKSTRNKSASGVTIFAEGLNGDIAAVTVGLQLNTLTPAERIRFKESLKRRGGLQEYLDCRYAGVYPHVTNEKIFILMYAVCCNTVNHPQVFRFKFIVPVQT